MTVRVDRAKDWDEVEVPAVIVTTTDGAGTERKYWIALTTDETFDDGRLLSGRRIDDDAPDEPAGGGPSDRAYAAARRAFEERGFDVHGGEADE